MKRQTISWDRAKLATLKTAYYRAMAERQDRFTFTEHMPRHPPIDHEFEIGEAAVMIHDLEFMFEQHPDQPAKVNKEGQEGQ